MCVRVRECVLLKVATKSSIHTLNRKKTCANQAWVSSLVGQLLLSEGLAHKTKTTGG